MTHHNPRKEGSYGACHSSHLGFSTVESLALLLISIALLWLALPIVFVHYGIIKPTDAAKTQPIRLPVIDETDKEEEIKTLLPPPPSEGVNKLNLPPNLEKLTKGFGSQINIPPK
jgi:hypothetical protein